MRAEMRSILARNHTTFGNSELQGQMCVWAKRAAAAFGSLFDKNSPFRHQKSDAFCSMQQPTCRTGPRSSLAPSEPAPGCILGSGGRFWGSPAPPRPTCRPPVGLDLGKVRLTCIAQIVFGPRGGRTQRGSAAGLIFPPLMHRTQRPVWGDRPDAAKNAVPLISLAHARARAIDRDPTGRRVDLPDAPASACPSL